MQSVMCLVAVLACMGLLEETSARNSCSENQFECDNGYCIPDRWMCDGYSDCSHGEDEYYCSTTGHYYTDSTENPTCTDDEYQCWQGGCIPAGWVCNSFQDCYYGDDEDDCDSTGMTEEPMCPDDYYQCEYSGECIPDYWVCDGYGDCPFATDEQNCTNSTTTTSSTTPPSQQDCRDSFDYIYDRCVLVDPFTATNWDEGRYLCEKFSSDLVVLNDYNFYAELLQYIRGKGLDYHSYWVGATDRAVEGMWLWVDYSPVPSGAPLWALYGCTGDYQLEPRPSDAYSQNCGFLDKDRGLYMSDASCYESFGTICQATSTKKETVVEEPIEKEITK